MYCTNCSADWGDMRKVIAAIQNQSKETDKRTHTHTHTKKIQGKMVENTFYISEKSNYVCIA